MVELYERVEGETNKAFEAFTAYRDLGASRSLAQVSKKLAKATSVLGRWASRYDWKTRVEAWDSKLDCVKIQTTLRGVEDMRKDYLRIAGKMRHIAELALDQVIEVADDPQRRGGLAIDLDDARKLTADANKLERSCLGEPDLVTEQRVKMTVEEERDIFRQILKNPKALKGLDTMVGALDGPSDNDITH